MVVLGVILPTDAQATRDAAADMMVFVLRNKGE